MVEFCFLQSLRLASQATSLYTREAHCRPTVHLKGVTHYNTLHSKACEKEYEQKCSYSFCVSVGKTCFMVGTPWTAFVFLLYSQFRCHAQKVNKIKGVATFEAVLCASLIDDYCSRILLTHSINSFSSLIFDINNTAHTTEIKINASIS